MLSQKQTDFPDDTLQNGTVVIRSHGVGKAIYDKLKEKNISYVDVTCPFVLKIHRIVEKKALQETTSSSSATKTTLKYRASAAGVRDRTR